MSVKLRKIAIIGTGHVGSHVAFALATQGEVDELYMVDSDKDKALAQATDVKDAVSYLPHHVSAIPCEIEDCTDCDIMVISAGPLPAPEQDRLESLGSTVEVLKEIIPRIKKSGFQGIIVSISNPADVVAAYIQQELDYPTNKIISTGTALDSSRLQMILSGLFNINRRSLTAYSMGEHGSSAMVPWSHVYVAGKPLDELQAEMPHRFPTFDRDKLVSDMKYGGYLVLKGKGSTEFGIASSAVEIIRAILHDEKKVLPVSTYLKGVYGQDGVFASVPTILGKDGVEEVLEIHVTEDEQKAFNHSCQLINEHLEKANHM